MNDDLNASLSCWLLTLGKEEGKEGKEHGGIERERRLVLGGLGDAGVLGPPVGFPSEEPMGGWEVERITTQSSSSSSPQVE